MTLIDVNGFVFQLLTSIAALLLEPPYFWFTCLFIIGGVVAIIKRIIDF